MDARQVDVFKILEYKNGCVYKTKKLKTIWINADLSDEAQRQIANFHGGHTLAPTVNYVFGVKSVNPQGQAHKPI